MLSSLVLSVTATVLLYTYKRALEYPHPARVMRLANDTPARYGVRYHEIKLQTADRLTLAAWYTPPKNGVIILAAHGYQDIRSASVHAMFAQHGYGIVSWDFRAHGESEGDLSTLGYYEVRDVEAALDFALRQPEVKSVGAWGASMGGATTIIAAAKRPEIKAVIADSAFAALADELNTMVKVPPLRPLVRFFAEREAGLSVELVRPIDHIARLSPRPVFLIQGLADTAVPPDTAMRLYTAAGEPRQVWQEPNVEHVAMRQAYPERYEQKVFAFLAQALLAK